MDLFTLPVFEQYTTGFNIEWDLTLFIIPFVIFRTLILLFKFSNAFLLLLFFFFRRFCRTRYTTGSWVHITITAKPELVQNGITMTFYFDGVQECQSFIAASNDDRYPCPYDGFQFGRHVQHITEYDNKLSCFRLINQYDVDPYKLIEDCEKVFAGKYDHLFTGNGYQPTTLLPLSAQTEGLNTVNGPHGVMINNGYNFTTNEFGFPNAAFHFEGLQNQQFYVRNLNVNF